jgi:hypothetical protein
MPIFVVPNSLGSARLKEGNPCHEPGGSSKGGQFGVKGTCGASPTEPTLPTKKKYKKGENISSLKDEGEDHIERAVFNGKLGKDVAEELVKYSDESRFDVSYDTEGSVEDSDDDEDGSENPAYQQWESAQRDALMERTREEWRDEGKLSDLRDRWGEMREVIDAALSEKSADTTGRLFGEPPGKIIDANAVAGLLTAAGMTGKVTTWKRGGYSETTWAWEQPLTDEQRESLRQYVLQNYPGDYTNVTNSANRVFSPHGESDLTEYLPSGHGLPRLEAVENDAIDSADFSYDTWRQDHQPSSGGNPTVNMSIDGKDYEMQMRRNFIKEETGTFHVHHSYWRFGSDSPPGEGKKMFRGMFEEYQRLDVDRLSTYANINVGTYAWGRYGFVPASHRSMASKMKVNADNMFRHLNLPMHDAYSDEIAVKQPDGTLARKAVRVAYTPTERMKKAAMTLVQRYLDDPGDRAFWSIVDAKWRKAGVAKDYTGKEYPIDVSLGKMLMLQMGGWDAEFDFHNPSHVARMKRYIYGKKK